MDLQHDPKNLQRVLYFTAERSEPGGKRDRTERSSAGASRRDHGERGQSQPVAVFGCADDGLDERGEKKYIKQYLNWLASLHVVGML